MTGGPVASSGTGGRLLGRGRGVARAANYYRLMPASIAIGSRRVGGGAPCLVIAEAGVNHDGDPELAVELVRAAARAGADAVKFQLFAADRLATDAAPTAPYQARATGTRGQQELLRALELPAAELARVAEAAAAAGILFLASAFDDESVDALARLGAPALKIASPDLVNPFLLEHAARTGLPLLVSTGMSDLAEVRTALRLLDAAGARELVLLHCVSSYPAEAEDANLRALAALAELGHPVGFSDHTLGTEVALAAVALGAAVLEKHFTLDRSRTGPDHAASLEPGELAELVAAVRRVESALGDGIKRPVAAELANRESVRRSIAAARDVAAGERLERAMLTALRPATAIPALEVDRVVGRTARRAIRRGELVAWTDLA